MTVQAGAGAVTRTTVASSWAWMRLDLLLRLVPLTLVPLVFSWLSGTPLRSLGLVITHPLRDLLVAIPAGLAGFAIAAAFNVYLSRRSGRWFVPTKPDLLVQSGYYLVLNAPIEGGTWFALRPWGVAMLGFAVFFLLPEGSSAQVPIVVVSLILIAGGAVFTVWVPSWAKPPWARQ